MMTCRWSSVLSLDQNLLIQPVSVYTEMVSEYMALSDLDEATRRMKELFTGFAAEEKVDGSGRIRLDSGLREIAGARKEVTCVGKMGAFEVWDREKVGSDPGGDVEESGVVDKTDGRENQELEKAIAN